MAIQDKAMLMHQVEQTLHPRMFANLLEEAMTEINGHLDEYDVRHLGESSGTDNLLDSFINAKKVEGLSESTLSLYRYNIERFMMFANVKTRDVTTHHIREYLAHEQNRGLSDTTVNNLRSILNSYFSWLDQEKLITSNPVKSIGVIKCQKKVRESISDADMERLKRSCKNLRDIAILNLLASTGCRISEITNLNRNDVDLENMECTVLGKGNKERTVYLNEVAAMTLKEYLAKRKDRYPALFIGKRKNRLHPNGVREMLKQLAERSGVTNIHPHRFRRTLITNLLNRGMPIQEVAIVVGHDKIDTTMRYFSSSKARIKNSYRKYIS